MSPTNCNRQVFTGTHSEGVNHEITVFLVDLGAFKGAAFTPFTGFSEEFRESAAFNFMDFGKGEPRGVCRDGEIGRRSRGAV